MRLSYFLAFKGLWIALLCTVISSPLKAGELSSYRSVRPNKVDANTWFNVELGASLINGLVVQPGETFSFNRALDRRRSEFKKGRSFYKGKFIMSAGGGYCQVSTALYNAVLLADLPVKVRYHHSIYDPKAAYAPAGLDASVSNSNNADFKFVNSSCCPVTISAAAKNSSVQIRLLGDADTSKVWYSSTFKKIPKKIKTRFVSGLPAGVSRLARAGYDGYKAQRFKHRLDPHGITNTVSMGEDSYVSISEIIEVGKKRPPPLKEN